jgi:hypothetical protein
MQVGMAHPARRDADEDLIGSYFGYGEFFPAKRPFLNWGR